MIQQLAEPVKTKLRDRDRAIGANFVLTAPRVPLVNGFCKQLIGTLHQKRLDFLIPRTEQHLLRLLRDWLATQSGKGERFTKQKFPRSPCGAKRGSRLLLNCSIDGRTFAMSIVAGLTASRYQATSLTPSRLWRYDLIEYQISSG